ncbi:MAG: restriction endonuclease [Endozoicomonas sp.]|uniref:restriction endonuclease n=1 Tax=Endozoicomonas sp. TaxID=1892382 RepID=UPI003D9ACC7C
MSGWMIRAGRGGQYFEDFERGYVAIGWNDLGDLNQLKELSALREAYISLYDDSKPNRTSNAVHMLRKFRDEIKKGDLVTSYSPELREYLIGEDLGEYVYLDNGQLVGDYANARKVRWLGKISRDLLSQATRNSLGSTLTLFSLSDGVCQELLSVLEGKSKPVVESPEEEVDDLKAMMLDTISRGHELIKDKIHSLDPEEMEHMLAAVLRAMGYRTRVSPKGPDRGVDVTASPDGLGLTQPRIKAEVKHRTGSMGAQAIRSFLGALREGDKGLYVSTGGFSREARYEAERAAFPVTLIDMDDLADLIVTHYDQFDTEGRALLPMVRIYWPAE